LTLDKQVSISIMTAVTLKGLRPIIGKIRRGAWQRAGDRVDCCERLRPVLRPVRCRPFAPGHEPFLRRSNVKNSLISLVKVGVYVAVLAAIAFGTDALAKKPGGGGGGGCPRDIQCPDIWNPVICSDGVVYSNGCYAYQQCATGCVPYGDGGPIEAVTRN